MAEYVDYRPCPHPVTETHWVPMNQTLRHRLQQHPEVSYFPSFLVDEPLLFNPSLRKWMPMVCFYFKYDRMGYFVGKDRMLFCWNLFFCKARAKHFVWIKAHTAHQEFADLYTAVFRIKRPDAAKTKCLDFFEIVN